MAFDKISTELPKSFLYNLRKLSGGFGKQQIKVMGDRDKCIPNDIVTFRLPIGSILNMESLQLHAKITTTGTNVAILPRYTSTLIKRLSVSVNSVTVQIINDYNLVYSVYADTNYGNLTKRFGEFFDTTTRFTDGAVNGANPVDLVGANVLGNATAHLSNERIVINHFLGVLSGSTSVWDTDVMGEIVLSIQFDSAGILCGTPETTAVTYTDNSFELTQMYLLVESYSFINDDYYTSLSVGDKMIGFEDYNVVRFPATTKSAGVNCSTYVSASSLDCVIGTALTADGITSVPKTMIGYTANDTGGTVTNVYKYLADPVASTGNTGSVRAIKYGDGFFSTLNMLRDLQFIRTSVFSLNNRQINFAPLDPLEIHNQNLLALGYENQDMGADGFNPSCVSLRHFFKYYGACFQDMSLLNPNVFYLSGLNTQGASCAVNWTATFDTACTQVIYPILIVKSSRVLNIGAGRQINVE
jgi:hypothetical protein